MPIAALQHWLPASSTKKRMAVGYWLIVIGWRKNFNKAMPPNEKEMLPILRNKSGSLWALAACLNHPKPWAISECRIFTIHHSPLTTHHAPTSSPRANTPSFHLRGEELPGRSPRVRRSPALGPAAEGECSIRNIAVGRQCSRCWVPASDLPS